MRHNIALRDALDHLQITQKELCKMLGVSPGTVSQWFTNFRKIPHLRAIAIEKLTDGKVSRRDLAPDYPWDELE